MTRANLTPETVQSMIGDYQAGAGKRELSKRYGICKETVIALVRAHGVEVRPSGGRTGHRVPPETLQRMIADYQNGFSLERIAHQYQMHTSTVRAVLTANGVVIRSQGQHSHRGPAARKDPPVGATFGGSTVVGPADIPYTVDRSGGRTYRVRVECWSCKTQRDVAVSALRRGASRMCRACFSQSNRSGVVYAK